MKWLERVFIIDGYVDEPTCLGVPPYLATYPRYVAGSIWTRLPHAEIIYQTIDAVRKNPAASIEAWTSADLLVLIAGMIVPGKYLGGNPISVREAQEIFSAGLISNIAKILVGPWARFGCGLEGGKQALHPDVLSPPFDSIVDGDAGAVLDEYLTENTHPKELDPTRKREDYEKFEESVIRGTHIVTQHPGYPQKHLICEIETYSGCPRYLSGGCSFCVEPLQGSPKQRSVDAILQEIESLYQQGIRAFRIGNQPDLFTYGSQEMSVEEFPKPSPDTIERLFSGICSVAPTLEVLHVDNINPGTIAHHPEESRSIAKTIVKHHTPGDVAAFGVESFDPRVVKENNLKASGDEIIEAVRILNEVGAKRMGRGLPHLLPGINLLYGLPGERTQTIEYNMDYLLRILQEGLVLRRINIRQVIQIPGTRASGMDKSKLDQHEFYRHKRKVRENIDLPMIKRVAPQGTVIHSAFVETQRGKNVLLRTLGTYPLLCHMPNGRHHDTRMDLVVVDHGPRSLTVLPYPIRPEKMSLRQWSAIPGIGTKRAARLKIASGSKNHWAIRESVDMEMPVWLIDSLSTDACES
ncbi:MAG: radical SAM protein [Promethearchaeati archaeon]